MPIEPFEGKMGEGMTIDMKEFKREKNKYLVLKQEDIYNFLTPSQKICLDDICDTIGYARKQLHKAVNNYVVINQDEDYIEKVWALIKEGESKKK
jgi:hypothetical protein